MTDIVFELMLALLTIFVFCFIIIYAVTDILLNEDKLGFRKYDLWLNWSAMN